MRVALAVMLATIFVVPPLDLARAAKFCPTGGYCAPGTCAKDGSRYACKVKKCSAENCKKRH